ncbi:hypothetical protein BDV09DRAFT_199690 [Aspergillus tetrazonus]
MLLHLLCILLFPVLSTATCYYPSGNPATSDVQCTPGKNSACCGNGAICLSNGYCLGIVQPFGLSRGSCTDPSFQIDECAKECLDIQRDTGCAIVPYNVTYEGVTYCCNSIVNNRSDIRPACASGTDPITLLSATIIPGAALLENYSLQSDTDSANTSAPSNQSEMETCPDSSSSNTAVIGAGVGVPLGVIGLVGIAWALLERRKRLHIVRHMTMAANAAGPLVAYTSTSEEYLQKNANWQPQYSEPVELGDGSRGLSRL